MDRKEAEARLIQKAQQDDSFRTRLKANPTAVISKEFDMQMPPQVKIQVLEETDDNMYLVLPPRKTAELDAERLAQVTGGSVSSSQIKSGTERLAEKVSNVSKRAQGGKKL